MAKLLLKGEKNMKKSLIGLFGLAALVITGCTPVTPSSETPSSELPSSSETTPSESSSELPSSEVPPVSSEEPSSEPQPSEEPAITLTIAAALEIDAQPPYTFTYIGEKIRIEDAKLTTIFGDKAFIQQSFGETVGDLANMEIHVADWGECTGTRQIVTVEGTLADVGGHAVLEDAVIVEVNADADTGTYYWPGVDRSKWDGNFNRSFHGYWFTANVQLVSIPTTVVAGTAQTFQVVFPGEDNDATNPNNTFLIDVTIPAEITENEATYINEWLGGLYYVLNESTSEWEEVQGEPIAVGDYVEMFAMCDYTDYVASFVFNGSSALNTKPVEIDNVFTTWADVAIEELIVDGEGFAFMEDSNAYSYVVDDSRWGTSVYDPENSAIFVTAYTYDAEGLSEYVINAVTEAEWQVADYSESDGVVIAANDDGLIIYVWLYTEGYIEFYFQGVSTYMVSQNSADAIAGIEDYADLYGVRVDTETEEYIEHTTAFAPIETVIDDFELTGVQPYMAEVDYLARVEDEGEVALLVEGLAFVFVAENEGAASALTAAYEQYVFYNFEEANLPFLANFGLQNTSGLYNAETQEFVFASRTEAIGGGLYITQYQFVVLNDLYASSLIETNSGTNSDAAFTVLEDIFTVLGAQPVENENYFYVNGSYSAYLSIEEDASAEAVPALFEELLSVLPEYLVVVDTVQNSESDYKVTLTTEDGSIEVVINVYYDDFFECINIDIKITPASTSGELSEAEATIKYIASILFGGVDPVEGTHYINGGEGHYWTAGSLNGFTTREEVIENIVPLLIPEGFTQHGEVAESQIAEDGTMGLTVSFVNSSYTVEIIFTVYINPNTGLVTLQVDVITLA